MYSIWLATSFPAASDFSAQRCQLSRANWRNALRSSTDQSCRVTPCPASSTATFLSRISVWIARLSAAFRSDTSRMRCRSGVRPSHAFLLHASCSVGMEWKPG